MLLFRQSCPHKSVKAYATMPIGIMGKKSLALLGDPGAVSGGRENSGEERLFPAPTNCPWVSEDEVDGVYQRHVVLPGTPEHGTPEHRNITGYSGTPKKSGTRPKTRKTPKKTRNLKKQMARQHVTARVSFSKLPPLIAHKIN